MKMRLTTHKGEKTKQYDQNNGGFRKFFFVIFIDIKEIKYRYRKIIIIFNF
jgi:hypothetical protein